ncbi:MAG: Ig-like domain repeat protein [Geobacteraceae bacterium]|nr:Ig-like domain repeat protein [Geobacteraceae bacterium]
MKIKNFGMARWVGRLLLVVCLMVSSAAAAHAWIINGTVTNNTARSGRVYMSLQQNGGDTGLGLSIPAPTPGTAFQIHGVPNGTYTLKAFVDGSSTGRLHPADPTWSSPGAITISGSDHTLDSNTTVNFSPAPNVSPVAPLGAQIIPGDNGAFVGWQTLQDTNGNTIDNADSYNVYYSTTNTIPTSGTTPTYINIPAGDQTFAIFHVPNGTPLYIQVTALVGNTQSTATAVASKTINPPTPGFTITGTINLSGITNPAGNLYIALVDQTGKGGPVAVAYVNSSPQLNGNAFTITTNSTSVPNGTYSLYALIDMNSDGKISSGDVMPSDQSAPTVNVTGSNLTGQTVTLTKSNSTPFINTTHYQDSSTPPNEGYNVVLGAKAKTEVLTNFTVNSGPSNGLSYPIDLGLNSWGEFQAWLNVNSNRPQPADAYNVTINYANGIAPDTLNLNPTVVLDSFATSLAPAGTFPFAAITNPVTTNFTWGAPATPPSLTPYTFSLWSSIPGFPGNNNQYSNMPSSTLAQSVSGLTYADGVTNGWTVSVQDAAGNQAQKSVTLTYTSAPAITSFTPASAVPGTVVTLTGINFDPTLANNTVTFNGTATPAVVQSATTTQLTVVVPNGASSGIIQVTVGSKSGSSPTTITILPTITVNGRVTDFVSGLNVTGATVTINSAILTTSTTTTGADPSPNYSFSNVPSGTNFTLSITATGYDPAYSGTINTGTNITRNFPMYAAGTVTGWNGGAGQGVIRGRVIDNTNPNSSTNGIIGATVSTPGYTIVYANNDAAQTPNPALTSTTSNGVFYILHVPDGTTLTMTATATGYVFMPATATATAHANAVTFSTNRGYPAISVSGTITNSAKTGLTGATIAQLGTSNTTTSTTGGAFTINNLPSGTSFELKMSLDPTYVPNYTGPITSSNSFALPSPVVLLTPTEFAALGISSGKGAVIGRVANMQNLAAPINGMQVTASPYTVLYYDQTYNSGTGGFNPAATATDASGMFIVMNVDEGASVNVNATGYLNNISGFTNLTTHANAVSEIAVPCNVPSVSAGYLPPYLNPSSLTVLTSHATPTISSQVYVPWSIASAAAPGLFAQIGYGPSGTDPSTWANSQWTTANYSSSGGNNYFYAASFISPATAGTYAYVFRYSSFGGPYTYIGTTVFSGPAQPSNSGTLTVNTPISTTTALALNSGANPSIFGQGVGFTATVSPAAATGTVQLYVDGNLVASSIISSGSASFAPITNLTVGPHTITAVYSGDTTYDVSTSAGLSQTVNDGIKIGSIGNFLTLQSAITVAVDTNVLLLRDTRFAEDLIVNRTLPFTITLNGGLSSDFTTPVGITSVRSLRIQQGRVNAVRLVVKPD